MKTFISASLALVILALPHWQARGAENTEGARYVIGLTPFLEKSAKDDIYRRIAGMILEDLPQKSSLAIYDAYHLTNITRLDIPDVRAFRSGKTRANQFRDQILQVRQFLGSEHSAPDVARLSFTNAIRFPQFMDFLGETLGSGR